MISKKILPLMLLILSTVLWAEEQKGSLEGVSLESRIYNETYSDNEGGAYNWDVTLMPTLHFSTKGPMEIAPYLLVRYEIESNEETIVDTNKIQTDLRRLSLGIGSGFYWNLVDMEYIDVITGFRSEVQIFLPERGASAPTGYYNVDPATGTMSLMVDIPIGLEMNPFNNLSFRIWTEALRLGIRLDENYYRDDIKERTITFFSYSPFWTANWAPETKKDWHSFAIPISISWIWRF